MKNEKQAKLKASAGASRSTQRTQILAFDAMELEHDGVPLYYLRTVPGDAIREARFSAVGIGSSNIKASYPAAFDIRTQPSEARS
ncbi:hypothetical protein N5J76_21370 [Pseudomonas sp. GD03855]|nr:hypothetical protein [Pseudomonas sp. GD03909]MDH2248663.1 hypothetical protein [Pseudomonas sp. GD03856]MDH2267448.1 hypothetical protein [Pseudomonas sp. GD03855]